MRDVRWRFGGSGEYFMACLPAAPVRSIRQTPKARQVSPESCCCGLMETCMRRASDNMQVDDWVIIVARMVLIGLWSVSPLTFLDYAAPDRATCSVS